MIIVIMDIVIELSKYFFSLGKLIRDGSSKMFFCLKISFVISVLKILRERREPIRVLPKAISKRDSSIND